MAITGLWTDVRALRERMQQRAPDGMEAVVKITLRSGASLTPTVVQDLGEGWLAFETPDENPDQRAVVAVMQGDIAEVRCHFAPTAKWQTGFAVGEIAG